MISVIIPTYNADATLAPTLTALVPAVVDGIVQEAILVDGGSTDDTCVIADAAGTRLIRTKLGRGTQLQSGAAAARGRWVTRRHRDAAEERGDWLLFPQAAAGGGRGGAQEPQAFIERLTSGRRAQAAAAFRFALDDDG